MAPRGTDRQPGRPRRRSAISQKSAHGQPKKRQWASTYRICHSKWRRAVNFGLDHVARHVGLRTDEACKVGQAHDDQSQNLLAGGPVLSKSSTKGGPSHQGDFVYRPYQGISGIIRRARDENDPISANLWLCLLDLDVECFKFFLGRSHGKDWFDLERGLSVSHTIF